MNVYKPKRLGVYAFQKCMKLLLEMDRLILTRVKIY